jgi:uncharacterized membrane protein
MKLSTNDGNSIENHSFTIDSDMIDPQPQHCIEDKSNSTEHEIHHYYLSSVFESTVEWINSAAGFLILFAVILSTYNLMLALSNSVLGSKFKMLNPLHKMKAEVATIGQIRLMLSEYTSLALSVLVAADVLDTVIKPSHAYLVADGNRYEK